ncbi:hypothetical protein [Olleya sp. R77988]|uniref:hypothetical protein n=1 Tax=Olleya sp. R77988 TaxID=3093875 RepID=UPI0037C847C4
MKKFENIKRFLKQIKESPELSSIAEDKKVSILLGILEPTIGPIVDSLLLGKVRDKNLNNKFEELDSRLENRITEDDGIQLINIIQENRQMLWTSIANHQALIDEHNLLKNTISTYLAIPNNQSKTFKPSKDFKFIVIAGASGTGKDVQLELLEKHQFNKYRHSDVLKKFSTRKKRNHDSEYYKFMTEKRFDSLKEKGNVLFPYKKRSYQYGFDKVQFVRDATGNNLLFSIFTEFEMAEKANAFLKELGINVQFILFNASIQDLTRRAWHRNFSRDEVKRRITSVEQDIMFIEQNKEVLSSIYDFVEVGDNRSIIEIHNDLVKLIDK